MTILEHVNSHKRIIEILKWADNFDFKVNSLSVKNGSQCESGSIHYSVESYLEKAIDTIIKNSKKEVLDMAIKLAEEDLSEAVKAGSTPAASEPKG